MKTRHSSIRSFIAIVLILAVTIGFAYDLYNIQIKNHDYYVSQNNAVKSYKVPIEPARGEIVDRNGNSLVTNRNGNSIILDAAYFPSKSDNIKRNAVIINLIHLFQKNAEEFVNHLPLALDNGNIVFTDDEEEITKMKSKDMFNLQKYATAQNCYDAMTEAYGLEAFDTETALQIGGIRYELTRLLFSIENPVVIAENVSNETVAAIKEDKEAYLGADVKVTSYREYTNPELAPHILGTVRKINAEEYAELKEMP